VGLQLDQACPPYGVRGRAGRSSFLLLGACSRQDRGAAVHHWAMPAELPGTEQGQHIFELWQGAWIAALITGGITWGLIFYACWRYRRRSDDEIPVQTRYNLPLEIFYTIAPIMMVIVFFAHTVRVQNAVLDDTPAPRHTCPGRRPAVVVDVQLQRLGLRRRTAGVYDRRHRLGHPDARAPGRQDHPVQPALARRHPLLLDPGFLMKMDVIPGRREPLLGHAPTGGRLPGKCTELCGVYHSRMLFNVKVVDSADYEAYLATSQGPGARPTSRCSAASTPHHRRLEVTHTEDRRPRVTATAAPDRVTAASRWAHRSSGS
jgi:cytochrome c oxidase subunit 2